jgi:hypothetical protein
MTTYSTEKSPLIVSLSTNSHDRDSFKRPFLPEVSAVIPANPGWGSGTGAGIQRSKASLDSRLRGSDVPRNHVSSRPMGRN